jgi:hypothetical protein
MHRLTGRTVGEAAGTTPSSSSGSGSLFPHCANPRCATGWIHLWRSRRVPGFEGRWACSAECMEELVAAAVRREMNGGDAISLPHPHRLPMGLMLVEQGGITPAQLREALEGQQRAAEQTGETVRLGEWLVRSGVLGEPALMRALSAQWNCPVFPLANYHPEEVATAMPRFLSEALGALPVRAAAGRVLYVAFSGRIDRSLSYALERMNGMRVAAGLARDSEFEGAQAGFLGTPAPATRFLEAASSWVLVRAIAERIESERPVEARLARIHDYYWLRLWRRGAEGPGLPAPGGVEDLLATVGSPGKSAG